MSKAADRSSSKRTTHCLSSIDSVYHFEHVEALSHNCGVSDKQTEDFHSDQYHTNNSSDAWLQLFSNFRQKLQVRYRSKADDDRIVSHDAARFMLHYHCVRDIT